MREKMKIVFITHYSELLGANRSLLNLIQQLRTHVEVEVGVIVPTEGPLVSVLKEWKVSFEIIPFTYSFVSFNSNWKGKLITGFQNFADVLRIYRLSKLLKKASLVYSNSSVIAHGFIISRILGKPHIWHIREYGLEDYNLIPVFGQKVQTWFARKSEILIFISNHLKAAKSNWVKIEAKAPVIYNGVFSASQKPDFSRQFDKKPVCICFAGLMSEKKNALEALDLITELSKKNISTKLIVCAKMEGAYAVKFQNELIRRNLSDRVDFRGFVDNIQSVLSECDFLIMPSRNEAMGRVTVEAMSAGVPVVGFKSGGTAELFEHNISGIYYLDIEESVRTIEKMTSHEYVKMRDMAFKTAVLKYTTEAYGENIYKLCKDLISREND